jgi:ABC-type multidrug transport system fused ATPase/permease subunit
MPTKVAACRSAVASACRALPVRSRSARAHAGFIIAFSFNWKLTLVVSASVPLIAFAGIMQARVMWGLNAQARAACMHCEPMSLHARSRLCSRRACAPLRQVSKAADVANQMASEALAAVRTVAAFSMEAAFVAEFTRELAKPWRKFQETAVVTGLAFGASSAIIFLVGAAGSLAPRLFVSSCGCACAGNQRSMAVHVLCRYTR